MARSGFLLVITAGRNAPKNPLLCYDRRHYMKALRELSKDFNEKINYNVFSLDEKRQRRYKTVCKKRRRKR